MADSFTGSGTLDFSKAAYDRMAYFALRPELYFDQAADVQPTAQSMPGASVQFTIVNDLPIASTALTETSDISTVALSDSVVSLTLAEYGNGVLTTAKLRGTSFVDIDPIVANVVGYNAGVSLDTIARAALDSGTNVQYASGLGATALQTSVLLVQPLLRPTPSPLWTFVLLVPVCARRTYLPSVVTTLDSFTQTSLQTFRAKRLLARTFRAGVLHTSTLSQVKSGLVSSVRSRVSVGSKLHALLYSLLLVLRPPTFTAPSSWVARLLPRLTHT